MEGDIQGIVQSNVAGCSVHTIHGDEIRGPAIWFRDVFKYVRDNGLHLVCHAGETAGPDQLRQDILNHHRKLESLVRSQKFAGVNDEVEDLENDLDALLEQIKTEIEAIKTQAEDLQREARQGNKGGNAEAACQNLQTAIKGAAGLRLYPPTAASGGAAKP